MLAQLPRGDVCEWQCRSVFFDSNLAYSALWDKRKQLQNKSLGTGPGTVAALRQAACLRSTSTRPLPMPRSSTPRRCGGSWRRRSAGDRVLIVRGGTTPGAEGGSDREWLSRQIAAAGTVDFVAAYERGAPQFDADQRALARQAATDGSVWLLSSSEAVGTWPPPCPASTGARPRTGHAPAHCAGGAGGRIWQRQ